MKPASYKRWQEDIVVFGDKENALLAACCRRDVVNGFGADLMLVFIGGEGNR